MTHSVENDAALPPGKGSGLSWRIVGLADALRRCAVYEGDYTREDWITYAQALISSMAGEVVIKGQPVRHRPTCGHVGGNRHLRPALPTDPPAQCCHRVEASPPPNPGVPSKKGAARPHPQPPGRPTR